MMALLPKLVELKYAQKQIPGEVFADYGVNRIWDIGEISTTGATGDPRCASVEKGERILACLVDVLCTLLRKLDATDWQHVPDR